MTLTWGGQQQKVMVGGRVGRCVKAGLCLVILHQMLKHRVTIQYLRYTGYPTPQHLVQHHQTL